MVFGDLLVVGATWALCLAGVWAALIVAAAVVEVVSSGGLALTSRLGCPAPARRALLAGLGVVLASGGAVVAGPVSAAPAPFGQGAAGQAAGDQGRGQFGLPVPARPTGSAYPLPRQRVEVQPGDSLWRLSQQRSPATASTQDVARLVERTYRSNRRVIGPDPDLIHPGQRLRIPTQRRSTPPHLETP
jgi:nucleoid-associated protein YgaU